MHLKTPARKITAVIAASLVVSTLLVSCTDEETASKSDSVGCVYDGETGQLKGDPILPGSPKRSISSEDTVAWVPTSDRFYYVTDTSAKDPGAPDYLSALETISYKEVRSKLQAKFVVAASSACTWYDKHGRRNEPLNFNVRGDANTGWQQYLRETVLAAMDFAFEESVKGRQWPHLEYNYPVNADFNGAVPSGEEPGLLTYEDMQNEMGVLMKEYLDKYVGKNLFCGIGYNPADISSCPPLAVAIDDVYLADPTPAQQRAEIALQRETAENERQKAEIAAENAEQEARAYQAELERARIKADADAQAQIEAEEREQAVLIAEQATDELRNQQEAQKQLAVCAEAARIQNAPLSAQDCALILAALSGQYPQGNGTSISVGS